MNSSWLSRVRKRPVAWVLSGGGPLGAAQVGQIQALVLEGVVPDLVVGCSVGALNSLFFASDPTEHGAEVLADVWLGMRNEDLFPGGPLISAWNAIRRGSYVFSNAGLRRIIQEHLPARYFDELRLPAHIVATDMDTGEEHWFHEGRIVDPLLASAAMPGVFPPVTIDGRTFIDGGVANNVPISRAVQLGARRIYVLNTSGATQMRSLARPHDFMFHGFVLARGRRYRVDLEQYRRSAEIVDLPAIDGASVSFTNLSQTPRLIQAGFESARRFLRDGRSDEVVSETGA